MLDLAENVLLLVRADRHEIGTAGAIVAPVVARGLDAVFTVVERHSVTSIISPLCHIGKTLQATSLHSVPFGFHFGRRSKLRLYRQFRFETDAFTLYPQEKLCWLL